MKITHHLLIFLISFLIIGCDKAGQSPPIEEQIQNLVNELNQTYSSSAEHGSAKAIGNRLLLHTNLPDIDPRGINPAMLSQTVAPAWTKIACNDRELRELVDAGAVIEYTMTGAGGAPLPTIKITGKSCQQIMATPEIPGLGGYVDG